MTLNSLTLNGKTYDKFPADRTRGLILPAEITGNAASTISVPMSLISIPLSGYNPSIGDMVLTLDNCLYKITGFTVGEETEYTGKLIRTLSSGSSPNVTLDTTLTQSGQAADAAATGARLTALEQLGGITVIEPVEDDIPDVHFIVKGGMPFTKDEGDVQALMRYISKTATIERYCTAKVQGSSSASNADYKKRNWTINVYKDNTYEKKEKLSFKGWPAMNKFVLKAGWVIPGHLRNVGAAKIWGQIMRSRSDYGTLPEELRNSPNQGATDGFHVRVFVNGMYWGIYDWIVAKDQLFGQDKDNPAHSILNSEWNNQPTCAFSTTTPAINGNWSEELLDDMTADTKISMENWIKFVAGSTDEEFVANAENYFDVQSVIDAICFDRIIMTVDNMCRNQIVFKYDTKWFMGKWDLDAILGLPPVAGQTWYTYDTEYQEGYVAYKDYGITNLLYDRTEKLFLPRFKDNYWRLRSGPLSEANLVEVFGRLSDRLRSIEGLLAEENASTTGNGQFTGMPNVGKDTIQQIREMVSKRCAFMDDIVENMTGESGEGSGDDETTESIPCTGISLDAETLTFTEKGSQTLAATVEPENTTDSVVWASDNASVATVRDGVVTAISNGEATITARCGEYSATCTVAVSGIDSVNIFSGTEFKTAFINVSGVERTSSKDICCDFVDVEDYTGVPLVFDLTPDNNSNSGDNRVCFYDANHTFIGMATQNGSFGTAVDNIGNEVFDFSVPSGCKYMRISANNDVVGSSPLEALYIRRLDTNRYNAEDAQDGHYVLEDGVISTNSGYSHVSMPVRAGEKYFLKNVYSAVFFDDDGAWCGKALVKNAFCSATIPDGCATIGLNFSNAAVNTVEIYEIADTTPIGYYAVE